MKWYIITLISSFFIFHFALPLHAAPGDLDPTFAGTGKSRIAFGGASDDGRAVAVQADGKLIIVGNAANLYGLNPAFELARFGTNNVLDPSFGRGGTVSTVIGSGTNVVYAFGNAVGIQADGKIVVAGSVTWGNTEDFTLARYNPDGSLDPTFGASGTGIVHTDFGSDSAINAILIQPDGKIVVAGSIYDPGPDKYYFALARYGTNGVLDLSFGIGGTAVTTDFAGEAHGLMRQGDGSLVAVGSVDAAVSEFAVVRYTTNGGLDTTFGGTGEVFTPIGGSSTSATATGVALQRGGITVGNPDKIVVAGNVGETFAVARYNLDGSLDTTFGNGGIVANAISPGFQIESVQAVLVQKSYGPLGIVHIMVAGSAYVPGTNAFLLARFNGDGSPDTAFGANGDGIAEYSLGAGHEDRAYAMTFQAGKIVAAGYSYAWFDPSQGESFNGNFAAIRVNTDGSLDTTFGNGGLVIADIANLEARASAVAIQPDGRIVVAGSAQNSSLRLALARYQPDGTLDASFGLNGKVTTAFSPTNSSSANALAIQPDEKIVAAGVVFGGSGERFLVARYYSTGALDNFFGVNGQVTTGFGTNAAEAYTVAIQPDGKIIAVGYAGNPAEFALASYKPDGSLDDSFGSGGKLRTSILGHSDYANAVKVQPDGKIIAAGSSYTGANGEYAFALARYLSDGTLDNSFGTGGKVTTLFGAGNEAEVYGLALQPDGKIVVAGGVLTNATDFSAMALARYNTNGVLDPAFGTGGMVVTPIGPYTWANSLALEPDGKIVVAGYSENATNSVYAIARYDADGTLDTSYGIGGIVLASFENSPEDSGQAIAVDQIGRAVVAGVAGYLNDEFGVARLESGPFLKITTLTQVEGDILLLGGLGVPEQSQTLESAPTLAPGSFTPLDHVTANAAGQWQYEDFGVGGVSHRFYRLSYP